MRKTTIGFLSALLMTAAFIACAGEKSPDRRELSKREADSVLGASRLPGAGGITRAMTAADSAAAKAALLDSLSR